MGSLDAQVMEYRELGNTGIKVSVVGFGAAPLGNVFGATDPKEGQRAVHLAIEHGVNLFDVSPYYGITLAEERLGKALAGRRDKVVLATKCGRYGVDEFNYSARHIAATFEESLRRLQTDYIDVLQVHDVEFGDIQQIIDETIPKLRRLQEQGKIRAVGITGYMLKALKRIATTVAVDSVLTYCRYNLMITDMDQVLTPVTQELGIGLINASALNMGVLTEQGPSSWHPGTKELKEAGRRAVRLCRDRGVNLPEVALRFALDHTGVSSTLVGMSNTRHVQECLKALAARTDQDLLKELHELFKPVFNCVWPSGRLENHD
jgi:L-galactose dehydrogenase